MAIKFYSFEEFKDDVKVLAQKIDFDFDAIVAIARGGMTLGHFLGEYFETRNIFIINSIGYLETKKLDEIKIFNIPNLNGFEKILVIDDMVDSGESMQKVIQTLKNHNPNCSFKSAVLFQKDNSILKADYFVQKTQDWIEFFWNNKSLERREKQQ